MKNNWDFRDFVGHNGVYSSARLVFILTSLVALGIFIYDHENQGVQNIVITLLGASGIAFTAPKFAKPDNINQIDNGQNNIGEDPEIASEFEEGSRINSSRNRRSSKR